MSILNPYLQMALLRAERDEEHTSEDVYHCDCAVCRQWVFEQCVEWRFEDEQERRHGHDL